MSTDEAAPPVVFCYISPSRLRQEGFWESHQNGQSF